MKSFTRITIYAALLLPTFSACRTCQPSCLGTYLSGADVAFDQSAVQHPRDGTTSSRLGSSESEGGDAPRESPMNPETASGTLRLQLPHDLPGADAPPIRLPPRGENQSDDAWKNAVGALYPPLPNVPSSEAAESGPDGHPFDLATLQALAAENNPRIREAAAEVEAARGAYIQAGLPPNPVAGYEADTVRTARTNGYHGAYLAQTFVTMGKLRLAREAAEVQWQNAQLALRKTRVEVASQVRSHYFGTVVAREKIRLTRAMADLTDRVFRMQVELAQGGETAPYEPMQLRVLALQARTAVVQAEQQYQAEWRQLAASVGIPELPLTEVAGRVDDRLPVFTFDEVAALLLAQHTDIRIAENEIVQADLLLELARVTPWPNIDVNTVIQRDYTFTPGTTTYNLQLLGEIPVFNRNQGNIIAAQARRFQAEQRVPRVRNDLLRSLAEAYARYEASRRILSDLQRDALRDQVRVYRGVYERYRNDPQNIEFNDVVVAQQTLGTLLGQYIDLLGTQWQAIVDVAQLAQVDDLFSLGTAEPVMPIPTIAPDLE